MKIASEKQNGRQGSHAAALARTTFPETSVARNFEDNRPQARSCAQLLARMDRSLTPASKTFADAATGNILQLIPWSRGVLDGKQTDVTWGTSTLGGDTVGIDMTANPLGPEHLQGTPPQSGEQSTLMSRLPTDPSLPSDQKFVRGHLLNDNLGGEGRAYNLYPITADANKQHHDRIEKPVKKWVNEDKQWVRYDVSAVQRADNWYDSVFECRAQVLNPGTLQPQGPNVTAIIQSNYNLKSGHLNEVEETGGNLHPKGDEARDYAPLLSTSKAVFHGLNEDLQTSLIYCFAVDRSTTISKLKKINGIGQKTIALLEVMADEEDFSNPTEEQQRALKRIQTRDIDVLGAVAQVAWIVEENIG